MLPRTLCLLNTRIEGDRILPRYLGERDHGWLSALLDEHARFVGLRRSELRSRLTEALPVAAPKNKLRLAARVLDRLTASRIEAAVSPVIVRSALFRAAAAADRARQSTLERVALELGCSAETLEGALFADLRSERRVAALSDDYTPSRLAFEINSALVAGLLARATRVRIRLEGNTRALMGQARLAGLICVVRGDAAGLCLDISGPFTLFRHTGVYGRALAALVPRLSRCDGFELVASCILSRESRVSTVVVRSGDPLAAGGNLVPFDSRVEARFAAEFERAAPDWDMIREPEPFPANGGLSYPDLELVHRRDPARRWLLEFVGFWTRDYLDRKLEQLRMANVDHLIVCVDEHKRCGREPAPTSSQLLCYRRRIDPAAVLALIDG